METEVANSSERKNFVQVPMVLRTASGVEGSGNCETVGEGIGARRQWMLLGARGER